MAQIVIMIFNLPSNVQTAGLDTQNFFSPSIRPHDKYH